MRHQVFAAAVVAALLLTGCTSAPKISALESPADAEDQLPAGITVWPEDEIPSSAVRFLVEHNEIRYFGAKSADGHRACVVAVRQDAEAMWVGGCSDLTDNQEVVHVSGVGVAETVLVSDGYDVDKLLDGGWKPIHKNIVIAAS
jgi:type IV pilus biogenesis protein CpaD/CtpE